MRLLLFVCALVFVQFCVVICEPIRNSDNKKNIATVGITGRDTFCKDKDAKFWSHGFHNCFIDRKANDGGQDLNNIVDRILDHSRDCIKNSTKHCRPDHEGFIVIMKEVIKEMKDYCFMYLESIFHDKDKIKDLDCVEKILSIETYKNCFKEVLRKNKSPAEFEKQIENAISCTNEANKKCSKEAKTDLNRMVRDILHVKQPATENIEDDKPPEPEAPMRWYDYIAQPFISLWKTIKSWFGW